MNPIDPVYFDRQIYAIYRAVWERWGDEAWYVVWRAGQVLLDEIEPELGLAPEDDAFAAMQRLADYLQRAGYVSAIAVRPVSDVEWDYEMRDPAILPGAERLLAEGAVPAHISTALMFALLDKHFGLKAEMVGEPDLRPDGTAVERWRLVDGGEGA
ncbi:MAG: hypothetical protein PVF47_16330 [Anaerolineae bacterium]|jgi:hypothetical protein